MQAPHVVDERRPITGNTRTPGCLVLVPNTLDLGSGQEIPLTELLPLGAIRRAAALTHWVVENAKSARAFLRRVNAEVPLVCPLQSMQIQELPRPVKGSREPRTTTAPWRKLLDPALAGHDIGLLSEAGLPAVADPGSELVAQAHQLGLVIEPWAGPSALLMTLAASGLGGQHFAFVGYLPVPPDDRARRLRELEQLSRRIGQTQMAIETPYRNAALMGAMLDHLQPQTRVCVACGLSLDGGWCRTATVSRWREAPPTFEGQLPAVFAWRA